MEHDALAPGRQAGGGSGNGPWRGLRRRGTIPAGHLRRIASGPVQPVEGGLGRLRGYCPHCLPEGAPQSAGRRSLCAPWRGHLGDWRKHRGACRPLGQWRRNGAMRTAPERVGSPVHGDRGRARQPPFSRHAPRLQRRRRRPVEGIETTRRHACALPSPQALFRRRLFIRPGLIRATIPLDYPVSYATAAAQP